MYYYNIITIQNILFNVLKHSQFNITELQTIGTFHDTCDSFASNLSTSI